MKLATIDLDGQEQAALRSGAGLVPLTRINHLVGLDFPTTMLELIRSERLNDLKARCAAHGSQIKDAPAVPIKDAALGPLYRNPAKIWGIGLNYSEHAGDLDESVPEGLPGSFNKPATTIIGPGDTIHIPMMSEATTAEAELGLIIGKKCKNVPREDWLSVVAGFTTIIDMTAEDILRRNPRFLTLCKSFDSFFVFGPELVTPDEVDDVLALNVSTIHNGRTHATNLVANMTYPPDYLVALHSEVMTLLPGDIISTGTPGAAPISHGDRVECHIDGFEPLVCPVEDLKLGTCP